MTGLRIERVLNEDIVITSIKDQKKFVIGKGIAADKRKGDPIYDNEIDKVIDMNGDMGQYEEFLSMVPQKIIRLTEDIITHAEDYLQTKLSDSVHLELADHLSFLLNDPPKHVTIQNGLIEEISILYAKEYQVGLWALRTIKERFDRELAEEEAGHIAIFIHSGRWMHEGTGESVKQVAIIRDLVWKIEKYYKKVLSKNNVAYQHLVTHLNRAIQRTREQSEFNMVDKNMLVMIQEKYQKAYQCAVDMTTYLSEKCDIHFPSSEIGYLTLHIHRAAKA